MRRIALLLLSLLLSPLCLAYSPASGLWWNPNESGRGYTIDTQDDVMIVTAYVYDSGRKATWFLASGTYNQNTDTFSGTLGAYSGGQCFGCSYTQPGGVAAGTVTIQFSSPESAILTYPGGQTAIEHQAYAYGAKREYFYGEWAFSYAVSGQLTTQWVVFNSTYTGSTGTLYILGQEDSVSGTAALGTYDDATASFIVAIAENDGYTTLYQMPTGDDRRMLGLGTVTQTGVTPGNPTLASAGSRLLFLSELGESKAKSAKPDPDKLARLEKSLQALRDNRR